MTELIVLNVYSDFSFSNTLLLFCVTKFTDVQVLMIKSKDLTGLVIFVSPNGIEILLIPKFERFLLANLLEVGKYKLD